MARVLKIAVVVAGMAGTGTALAQPAQRLDTIDVEASPPAPERLSSAPEAGRADSAAALRDIPNAALLNNGGLSGQTQFRGLSGYRNAVRIDGMGIASGGPNWMDPPLHYAPAALVETVEVTRGLPAVADSLDAIGTVIEAETDRGRYGEGRGYELGGRLSSSIRSVDNGHSLAGRVQAANVDTKVGLSAVRDRASATETPFGPIRASSLEREQYGLDFGRRWAAGETTGFVRHQDTGRSGTPALPLDIEFFDTTLAQLGHRGRLGENEVSARLSYNDVEHQMRNFQLRPAPDFSPRNGMTPDRRFINAESRGYGLELDIDRPALGGTASAGIDLQLAEHAATVRNPDSNAFFVDAFDDIRRDLYSLYGQWAGPVGARTTGEFGLRYTRVEMDAGAGGVAPGLPQPAQDLAADFAAADRRRSDNNIDIVAQITQSLNERWSASLGLARRTRLHYYLERYAYIPLEATAGLADGNNHIGDIGIEPEVAYEINLGTEFAGERLIFAPEVFYRRVHDYITGVAFDDTPGVIDSDVERVSNVNGDPTPLRYANVDAELYGLDLAAGYAISEAWRLDAGGGYTRGRRTDRNDDLYRIAPARLRARLTWARDDWRLSLTQRYIFEQNKVSEVHADPRLADRATPGYALTEIAGEYRLAEGLTATVGIDNLFDKGYRDFLAGYNRVQGSAIGVGERLPGAGRNAYASLEARF